MAAPSDGCAICGSTWGNLWEEIDGRRRFFCCAICARQYREVVAGVRARTGWPRVDTVTFTGDRRGRFAIAEHAGATYRFEVAFNSLGELRRFEPTDPTARGSD